MCYMIILCQAFNKEGATTIPLAVRFRNRSTAE
nr:MAG TPA: hypothetical protein [Caudoviricetes sp.]